MWLRFFRPCLARRDPRGYPTYGRDVTTPPTIKIYRERVRKKKKHGQDAHGTHGRDVHATKNHSWGRLCYICATFPLRSFVFSRGEFFFLNSKSAILNPQSEISPCAHKKSPGYGYPGAFRKKRHSPTLPQSQYHRPLRLHFCVRDGNRCFP